MHYAYIIQYHLNAIKRFFIFFFDYSALLPLSGPNKEISQTLLLELKHKNTSNMPLQLI